MPSIKKLYAIGFKDWIEIRSSPKPPRIDTSEVNKPYKEKIWYPPTNAELTAYYDASNWTGSAYHGTRKAKTPYPKGKQEVLEKQFKLKTVIFIGGRPICVIPRDKFRRMIGFTVGNGKCWKLSDKNVKMLVDNGFPKLSKYVNMPVTLKDNNVVEGTVGGG